jgi:hypothetical protein
MTPSIATKFQYVNSLLFSFLTHYTFRPLRAIFRRGIQLDIWRTILIQRIRCTYALLYRDVICCTSVLRLVVLIHVIKLNIKIKIVKSAKFHVTSVVVSYKSGLIYKMLKYQEEWTLSRISSRWSGRSSKFCGLLIHQRRGDQAVGSGGFLSYACYCLSLLRG